MSTIMWQGGAPKDSLDNRKKDKTMRSRSNQACCWIMASIWKKWQLDFLLCLYSQKNAMKACKSFQTKLLTININGCNFCFFLFLGVTLAFLNPDLLTQFNQVIFRTQCDSATRRYTKPNEDPVEQKTKVLQSWALDALASVGDLWKGLGHEIELRYFDKNA
jgi:hypothetical protein